MEARELDVSTTDSLTIDDIEWRRGKWQHLGNTAETNEHRGRKTEHTEHGPETVKIKQETP